MALLPAYDFKLVKCKTNPVVMSLISVFYMWLVDRFGEEHVVTRFLGIIKVDPDIRIGA